MARKNKQKSLTISLDERTHTQVTELKSLGFNLSKVLRQLIEDAYRKQQRGDKVNG